MRTGRPWPPAEWSFDRLDRELAWRKRAIDKYEDTGRQRYVVGLWNQCRRIRERIDELMGVTSA